MPLNILAAALTLGPPSAHAAPAVEVGLGLSEVFEERKPTVLLRAGRGGAITGELSGTYNPHSPPSPLTRALVSISGKEWPEDRELGAVKGLADFSLPAQERGWHGAPHLYLGMQGRRVQRTLTLLQADGQLNTIQADPPSWQLSPLIGAGISVSYGAVSARVTVHTATAPGRFVDRELTHCGSLDLLYRF